MNRIPSRSSLVGQTYRNKKSVEINLIEDNEKLFDQTHRNKKSTEINVIEDPEIVNESVWVRGLIKNGFEIWEGTSEDDLIIGNQERTNFIYAQWGDDDITGGDCIDHIIAGPGSNTVIGGGDADRFVLGKFEQTTILDFEKGIDKLIISTGIGHYSSKDVVKPGELTGIKVKKGVTAADTVVEAKIEGSISYFYLLGTAFETAANWNDLDIYLLGGMTGDGTENLIPLA